MSDYDIYYIRDNVSLILKEIIKLKVNVKIQNDKLNHILDYLDIEWIE